MFICMLRSMLQVTNGCQESVLSNKSILSYGILYITRPCTSHFTRTRGVRFKIIVILLYNIHPETVISAWITCMLILSNLKLKLNPNISNNASYDRKMGWDCFFKVIAIGVKTTIEFALAAMLTFRCAILSLAS